MYLLHVIRQKMSLCFDRLRSIIKSKDLFVPVTNSCSVTTCLVTTIISPYSLVLNNTPSFIMFMYVQNSVYFEFKWFDIKLSIRLELHLDIVNKRGLVCTIGMPTSRYQGTRWIWNGYWFLYDLLDITIIKI